jgi:hypothetical protein
MTNYMAEVARLLGVELGEEFQICGNGETTVKLTEDGLEIVTILGKLIDHANEVCLTKLITGKYAIKRKPWKPKYGDYYWSVSANPDNSFCYLKWEGAISDYSNYKLGNCYKTMSEAKENKSKWVSFYASDEVLKI